MEHPPSTDSIKELHPPLPKKPFIARSVQFCDRGEAVLVFYLESHEMCVLWYPANAILTMLPVSHTLSSLLVRSVTEIPTRRWVVTCNALSAVSWQIIISGYATFSADQRSLLISNLVNGIDSYLISGVSPGVPPTLQQTFRHPLRKNVPLQITSALQGDWVIGGSDDGSIRIFDQRSRELLKALHHGEGTQPTFMHVL